MYDKQWKLLLYLIVFTVFLSGCPVTEISKDMVSDTDFETGKAGVAYNQALVVFCSGEVLVRRDTEWSPVEVGEYVFQDESLKLGEEAFCELQFGEKSVVSIEPDTEIVLKSIFLKDGQADMAVEVKTGTVLCKVEKLLGNDKFEIRTRSAACGVRGTEFGVTVTKQNDTILAVQEGKVAVLPLPLDIEGLKRTAEGVDTEIDVLLQELEETAFMVSSDQEVVVTEDTLKDSAETVRRIRKDLSWLAENKNADPVKKKELRMTLKETIGALKKKKHAPKRVTNQWKEKFDRIRKIKMHKIKVGSDTVPAERPPAKKDSARERRLVRLRIQVFPRDAKIFLGRQFRGRGRFQGLFPPGEKLTFILKKTGYETETITLETGIKKQRLYEITLKEQGAQSLDKEPEKLPLELKKPEPSVRETDVKEEIKAELEDEKKISVSFGEQKTLLSSGALGLYSFPTSSVTLLSRRPFRILLTADNRGYIVAGRDLLHLEQARVIIPPGRPDAFDNSHIGISGAYVHHDGRVFVFYHGHDSRGMKTLNKNGILKGFYSRIGAAVSRDRGRTWRKAGVILESQKPREWEAYEDHQARGLGDACVLKDKSGKYLYMYYTEQSSVNQRGSLICMARAETTRPPVAGAWKKYYNGSFSENGIRGRDTAVMKARHINESDAVFPNVVYSKTLDTYIMVFNVNTWKEYLNNTGLETSGIYIAYSDDGIHWSVPSQIIRDYTVTLEGKSVSNQPAVIWDEDSDTEGWLVYAYSENWGFGENGTIPQYMAGRRISFRRE